MEEWEIIGLFLLGSFVCLIGILELRTYIWPWTKPKWFKFKKEQNTHSPLKAPTPIFFPEQMIATPNGMVPINNLKVGDQVFTLTGQTAFVSKVSLNPHGISGLWFEKRLEKTIIPTVKL